MFRQMLSPFFAPDSIAGPVGGGGRAPEMSKEDMVDFLSADKDEAEIIPLDDEDNTPTPKDKKDKTDDKDDKDDDDTEKEDEISEEDIESELEEELEGPTEEQLELMTPVRRKEILTKYPKLFKDFPYLERAYYRDQQFTEVFATIDDAKEAIDKAGTLDKFEHDLLSGNTERMLQAVKTNPKSFNKVIDNYMSTLANVDERAFNHVVGNTIKQTIMSMVQESRASNNEPLGMAAQILNQFVFGKSTFEPPKALSEPDKPGDDRDEKLTAREKAFHKNRLDTATGELKSRVTNAFKATIEANMDPKNSMTDYVRKNAVREAQEKLEVLITKDNRFQKIIDKLWEKAAEENFSKPALDKIRSTYMSKAKTLLKPVIQASRNDALRGMGKRVVKDKEDASDKKGPVRESGRPQSQTTNSGKSGKKEVPAGMSSLEFLMSDE